jgi:hypothetical protein
MQSATSFKLSKTFAFLAATTICLSMLAISPINAATKSGTSCFKVGSTTYLENRKFFCVKRAGKLIWNSGTDVVLPIRKSSSTETKAASTVNQKSTFFFFRYNASGQLERKGNYESSWLLAEAADTDGISETRLKAFAAIKGNTSDPLLQNKIVYTIGENVPKDMQLAYMKIVDKSYAFWGKFMTSKEVPIFIFTEKDRALLNSYWSLRWNGESTIARYENYLKFYDDQVAQLQRSAGAAAGPQDLKSAGNQGTNQLPGIDFYMGSKHSQEASLMIDHVAHEFTHVFQWTLTAGVPVSRTSGDWLKPETMTETDVRVPCSLFEGSAVTFGTSIPVDSARWYSDGMDVIIRRVQNADPKLVLKTNQDVISSLQKGRSWLPGFGDQAMGLGALAYEYLVGEYGFNAFVKLFQSIPKTANFDESMKAAIGLTEVEFYQKAAPHILKEWKRANGQV